MNQSIFWLIMILFSYWTAENYIDELDLLEIINNDLTFLNFHYLIVHPENTFQDFSPQFFEKMERFYDILHFIVQ